MKVLSWLIKLQVIPEMFNEKKKVDRLTDALIADALLELQEKNAYNTSKPEWLLNNWDSKVWRLNGWNGSTENPIFIHWRQLLPNGLLLTHPRYSFILERSKRLVAAIRTGPLATVTRSDLQRHTSIYLFALIRWMVLRGFDEAPYAILTFESLTIKDFEVFRKSISYGIPGLEMHLERCRDHLDALDSVGLKNLQTKEGKIDRKKLGRSVNIQPQRLFKPKIELLLQSYETDTKKVSFLVSKHKKHREYLGSKEKNLAQRSSELASETTVSDLVLIWSLLVKHSSDIDGLLTFNPFKDQKLKRLIKTIPHSPSGITPNIPMDTALVYLDSSLTWVLNYGVSLVDYHLRLERRLKDIRMNRSSRRDYYAPVAFEQVPQPKCLAPLNIVRMNHHASGTPIREMRKEMSCELAIDCLKAACFILISAMSARRLQEILNLYSDCVVEAFDGLDITFLIQKSSPHQILEKIQRPIPHIVALCVDLLKQLNISTHSSASSKPSDYIFANNEGQKISSLTIYRKLDLFADIVEIPTFRKPNENIERRWYLRSHELRKFFAFTYFWKTNNSNLPALSWFMAHTSCLETEEYLNTSLAGDEFPESIKLLTREALLNQTQSEDNQELNSMILKHFNVKKLELIDSRQFDKFVETLVKEEKINVEIIDNAKLKAGKEVCVQLLGDES